MSDLGVCRREAKQGKSFLMYVESIGNISLVIKERELNINNVQFTSAVTTIFVESTEVGYLMCQNA